MGKGTISMIARETLLKENRTALYVCNHSGGKDSQAMFKWLYDHVPHDQLIVVHAHLPEVEWEGTIDHIHKTTLGIPVHIVQANKTFFEMVDRRGMWPSPKFRQCTSDLKTAPISKFIRHYCKAHNYDLVFNCIGLRASESHTRAKQPPIKPNKKLTCSYRTVINVLPIHDYQLKTVFETYGITLEELQRRRSLYRLGKKQEALNNWPFVWTYVAGMSRHSCKICIMSNRSDLNCSASIDPENFDRYIYKETAIDHAFINPKKSTPTLQQIRKALPQKQEVLW